MQVVLVYLQPFWHNSLLKCRLQPEIMKNSPKPPILGSSRLTFLRSSSPVLVMTSSMSVPICNHFHVRRANNSRIMPFKEGEPLSPPHSWESPSPSGMKFCHEILETLSYHMVKTEVPISPGLEIIPRRDRQTDGQTDRITIANTRYSYALARKKKFFYHNLKKGYPVLIIFNTHIHDTTGHQMAVQFPTSLNICFCTT